MSKTEQVANYRKSNKEDRQGLLEELNNLEEVMHDAEQLHTLEEKVESMLNRGINPSESYKKWDDED